MSSAFVELHGPELNLQVADHIDAFDAVAPLLGEEHIGIAREGGVVALVHQSARLQRFEKVHHDGRSPHQTAEPAFVELPVLIYRQQYLHNMLPPYEIGDLLLCGHRFRDWLFQNGFCGNVQNLDVNRDA